jgi:GT2 family glycosyltransferase
VSGASASTSDGGRPQVGVVIATRNRRAVLLETLTRLQELPERPPAFVVDNASGDGTAAAVRDAFPGVGLIALPRNRGAFARNLGVERIGTPLVAFCDDDSWWEPGALARAAGLFRGFPSVGLVAARILVGPERRLDPTSAQMRGPAPNGLPGPPVEGFVACGAVVRRAAFTAAGGFCERFLIGSEESLLAIDMRAAGWQLCYADDVVAVHAPDSTVRADRSWLSRRNALWTSWLRRPAGRALRETAALARDAVSDPVARQALRASLRGLPWALSERRRRPSPASAAAPRGSARQAGSRRPSAGAWR